MLFSYKKVMFAALLLPLKHGLVISYIHGTFIGAKMLFSYQKVMFEEFSFPLRHYFLTMRKK